MRSRHDINRGGKGIVYGAVAGFILLLLLYVGLGMAKLSLEDDVRKLKRQNSVIRGEIEHLEITATNLRKGSRIKQVARDRLGMVEHDGAPLILY